MDEKQGSFFKEMLQFAILALVIVFPVRLFIAQPFIVSGASMDPTFNSGQYLIVDELSYRLEEPKRGEVVIFRYPLDPSKFFIKRIIALPEPYVENRGNGTNMTVSLSDSEYFVMGDNRPESSDSRVWGPLPEEDIVGRAFFRLLPLRKAGVFPGTYEK